MAQKQYKPTFIRAWRRLRNLTQEQLSSRLGEMDEDLTPTGLSMLERGERGYTQRTLEAIAEALGTDPASLLMRDPADDSFWPLFRELEKLEGQDRERAYRMIKAILGHD